MPPKRLKGFRKEKSPDDYPPRHNSPDTNGQRRNKKRSQRLQARNMSIYFRESLQFRSSTENDDFNESSSANGSEESFSISEKKVKKRTRKLKCRKCKYTTAQKKLLVQHLKTHSSKGLFYCAVCNRRFRTSLSLNHHKSTHKVKPYQCNDCAGTYRNNSDLIRHIRYKHTHEKPYKCQDCDHAFVERSKLVRHMRNHNRERPHQCTQCNYLSFDTLKFKHHLRNHKIESYKCEICSTRYVELNFLKTHMQQIHPETRTDYSCTKCSSQFPQLMDLHRHMKDLHTNIKLHENGDRTSQDQSLPLNKTYQCSECGLNFTQIGNLIGHIMICDKKHSNKNEKQDKKISGFDERGKKAISSELTAISDYLIRGEVILLPDTDADKYIMIKVMSDEDNMNQQKKISPQQLECTVRLETLNGFDTGFKWKESNAELENNILKNKDETVDEEIEPFYGFDLKDVQLATQTALRLNLQTCY